MAATDPLVETILRVIRGELREGRTDEVFVVLAVGPQDHEAHEEWAYEIEWGQLSGGRFMTSRRELGLYLPERDDEQAAAELAARIRAFQREWAR